MGGLSGAEYEESVFFRNLEQERYLVLVISRLGLANRLRSLANWYQIASMSDRTLLVSWEPTLDCNAKFTDLFIDGPPQFRIMGDHLPAAEDGVRYVEAIANKRNISNYAIYHDGDTNMWVDSRKAFVMSKKIPYSSAQVVITHYDGAISLEGVGCQQYMLMHSNFLTSLVPNQEAQDFLASMRTQHFVNRVMVGVHFRAHDAAQDWAVVPPLHGSSEAQIFGVGAPVESFLEVMSNIQNQFAYVDRHGRIKTHVRFFVASNSEEDKNKFRRAVPDGIFLAGDHRRDSENGMQLALLEWLALSESQFIVNTYGSSFAEQAAQVHRRPIVGIWDGMLLHHSSVLLPYCGHMQFVKAAGRQGIDSVYTEGTTDRREVICMFFFLHRISSYLSSALLILFLFLFISAWIGSIFTFETAKMFVVDLFSCSDPRCFCPDSAIIVVTRMGVTSRIHNCLRLSK